MEKKKLYEFVIEDDMNGTRIDMVLSALLSESSRSFIQKLIEAGEVQVNGVVANVKNRKMKTGDNVSVKIPDPQELEIVAENIPLEIVYEDDYVLVVNKPKGMVVHPAPGNYNGTLVNAVMYHCGDKLSSINGIVRPGIVHRIDKDTSGLLMIAKNDAAHQSLSMQLEQHSITRAYHAIVYNNFNQDAGTVDAPLGRDPKNRLRQMVLEKGGRRAVTHYKVLERFGSFTYIEARLETGRTHQIRVHMAHIKHPLLGDSLYGPKKTSFGVDSQMLHAKILGFIHPATREYMQFETELPEEFLEVLKKLRLKYGTA